MTNAENRMKDIIICALLTLRDYEVITQAQVGEIADELSKRIKVTHDSRKTKAGNVETQEQMP